MKFRKSYFYEDESRLLHNVSPMKYFPKTKNSENCRYKTYGIGIGYGKRGINSDMKTLPGPGSYNLPSLFDKRIQGKVPIN